MTLTKNIVGGITETATSGLIGGLANELATVLSNAAVAGNRVKFADDTTTNASYVRRYKLFHKTPTNAGYTQIQLVYANWKHDQNGESISGLTDQVIEAGIEHSSTFYRATFGGQDSYTLAVGEYVVSDPITVSLAAGDTYFELIKHYSTSQSTTIPVGRPVRSALGEGVGGSTDENVAIDDTFNTAVNTEGFGAFAIFGVPDTAVNSVMLFGDSITEGYNAGDADGDANGNYGAIERTLNSQIGVLNYAKASGLAVTFADDTRYTRLKAFLTSLPTGVITHGIWGGATNDILTGRGLAAVTSDVNGILEDMRGWGMLASCQTLIPNTESTDSWVTEGNQTTNTGFGAAGIADQYNEDLADGTIYTDFPIFDLRSAVQGTNTNVWGNNAGTAWTGDGDHLNLDGYAQVASSSVTLDFITEPDPFFGDSNIIFRHNMRRSTKTYTTDQATGDVASIAAYEGTGTFTTDAAGDEPLYDNASLAGCIESDDTSSYMDIDGLTGSTAQTFVAVFELPATPASRKNFFARNGTGNASLSHGTDGDLDIGLADNFSIPQVLASASSTAIFVIVTLNAADDIDVYANSATVSRSGFNPWDNPSNPRWWTATDLSLFQPTGSVGAEAGTKFAEVMLFDGDLASQNWTAQQAFDYFNAYYQLGL